MVSWGSYIAPLFKRGNDFQKKGGLTDYPADSSQGQVACPRKSFKDYLGPRIHGPFERMQLYRSPQFFKQLPTLFGTKLIDESTHLFNHGFGRLPGRPGRYATTSSRRRNVVPPISKVLNFPLAVSFEIACRVTPRSLAASAFVTQSFGEKFG